MNIRHEFIPGRVRRSPARQHATAKVVGIFRFVVVGFVFALIGSVSATDRARKPNIILILADDLGAGTADLCDSVEHARRAFGHGLSGGCKLPMGGGNEDGGQKTGEKAKRKKK